MKLLIILGAMFIAFSSQANAAAYAWTSGGNCWICNGGNPDMCTYCHDGACVTSKASASAIALQAKPAAKQFGPVGSTGLLGVKAMSQLENSMLHGNIISVGVTGTNVAGSANDVKNGKAQLKPLNKVDSLKSGKMSGVAQ